MNWLGTRHEFVCLIYIFDLVRGGSFVQWLFVIHHCSLQLTSSGCRVGGQEHNQMGSDVLLCLNVANQIYNMLQQETQSTPCNQIYLHHSDMSFLHITKRGKNAKFATLPKIVIAEILTLLQTVTLCSQFGLTLMFVFVNIL